MKKLFKIVSVALSAVVILAACDNKKTDGDQRNHFKIQATTYYIVGNEFDASQIRYDNGYITKLTLDSNLHSGRIVLECLSGTDAGLDNATYTFVNDYADADDFPLDGLSRNSYFSIYDIESGSRVNTPFVAGSTVVVTRSGNLYVITIDGTLEGGRRVTGYYKGQLNHLQ